MRKLVILTAALALLVSAGLCSDEAAGAAPKKAGDILLDKYVQTFKEMAEGRTAGMIALEERLQAMAADAKTAREKGEIDPYFLSWYQRILAITKLFIAPDPGQLLKPVIDRELDDFLMDTLGEKPVAGNGPGAVGQVAKALATQVINMQLYLDTLDKRAALMKKLGVAPGGGQD